VGRDGGRVAGSNVERCGAAARSGRDGHRHGGGELIRELKAQPATRAIPVLALLARSPQPPTGGRTAEAWLVKPVGPDGLLREIRQLLEKSHQLRHESNAVTSRAAALRERSRQLLERPRERPPALRTVDRACPECGRVLVWIERGRLGGVDYDYYRWCAHACGLFAFDRAGAKWVKLA
jgi:hypothetical protein